MNTKFFIQKIRSVIPKKNTEQLPSVPKSGTISKWNPALRKRNLVKLFQESAKRVDAACSSFPFSESALNNHLTDFISKHDIRSGVVYLPELLELNNNISWRAVFQRYPELEILDGRSIEKNGLITKLSKVDMAITGCNFLLADTGVAVMLSNRISGRLGSLLPPHHLIIAKSSQIVHCFSKLLDIPEQKESLGQSGTVILISGPSRTADIEKTLVKGVHGPLSLTFFILN